MSLGNTFVLAAVGLALLTTAVPPASANHGIHAFYVGAAGTCAITAVATYVSGNFDTQVWAFDFKNANCPAPQTNDSCLGFGSIEVGFTTISCTSGSTFSIGPTNVFALCCPTTSGYAYLISMGYGSFTGGQGTEIVTNF